MAGDIAKAPGRAFEGAPGAAGQAEPVSHPLAILTRPAGQSAPLARALRARGWEVCDWPALALTPLPAVDVPLPSAFDMVMFVSGNAVRFYFGQLAQTSGWESEGWPPSIPAATVGPGSARALLDCAGAAVRVIQPPAQAASFDSEALWAEIQRQELRPRNVLIVRGGQGGQGHGRGWLAEQFAARGARVTLYAAYRRGPAVWPPQRLGQLRAWQGAGRRAVWLVSSREALAAIVEHLGGAAQAMRLWQGGRIVAPHPRIAGAVADLARSCGVATTLGEGPSTAALAEGIVIQLCLPHDETVLNAIVN